MQAWVRLRSSDSHVQDFEIRVDCFSAFDMHNRCQQAVLHRLLDIIDVAADANAALRLPLVNKRRVWVISQFDCGG